MSPPSAPGALARPSPPNMGTCGCRSRLDVTPGVPGHPHPSQSHFLLRPHREQPRVSPPLSWGGPSWGGPSSAPALPTRAVKKSPSVQNHCIFQAAALLDLSVSWLRRGRGSLS